MLFSKKQGLEGQGRVNNLFYIVRDHRRNQRRLTQALAPSVSAHSSQHGRPAPPCPIHQTIASQREGDNTFKESPYQWKRRPMLRREQRQSFRFLCLSHASWLEWVLLIRCARKQKFKKTHMRETRGAMSIVQRRTNVQQLTCKMGWSFSFYSLLFSSFRLFELKQ